MKGDEIFVCVLMIATGIPIITLLIGIILSLIAETVRDLNKKRAAR